MRFAYIDSNGNEVPIPSVDALALRIELGAISDDTQLFDAQADQWGPAHSHEIYHSLSRSAGGDEGVGPPPVASPPAAAEEPEPPVAAEEPEPVVDVAELAAAPESDLAEAVAETPTDDASAGEDLGLTLAAATEVEVPEEASLLEGAEGTADALDLSLSDASFDLAEAPIPEEVVDASGLDLPDPTDDLGMGGMDLAPAHVSDPAEDEEPGGFDFGGMEGGLEMEVDDPVSDAMNFGADLDTGSPDLGPGGDFGAAEPTPDFSGGMELETAAEFDGGGFDASSGGSLDLEAPMSDFSPEAPPAWMEQDGPAGGSGGEDVMDFSSAVAGAGENEGEVAAPASERRPQRTKPSAPKHRKQRNFAGPLIGVVILLAIGVGGWAAWPIVQSTLAARGQPDTPAVYLPPISTELMPQMLNLGQTALALNFTEERGAWAAQNRIQSPPRQWPAGIYLANASAYGQVEDFWDGMADLLAGLRGIDLTAFDVAYASALSAEGVGEPDASVIRERADSGFVAATADRTAVYDQMGAVIDAAQSLHQFLVANEGSIEYVPASTATTDPVLEVEAANDQIRTGMEELLDAVTGALRDLGYREAVSANGLADAVLARVQQVGIQ